MREIYRTIVSALIFSKDGKLLMGKKDPAKGGVYPDCWHIPGGGVEMEQSLTEALIREVQEEVGIDIRPYEIKQLEDVSTGVSEKTLKDTGERVLCHMKFHKFEIIVKDKMAQEIELTLGDDLVSAQWLSKEELAFAKQIPGGKEFFQKMGYIS